MIFAPPTSNQRFSRLALGVVMAALLSLSSLQVVEAGHLHLEAGSASECLLCNDTLKVGISAYSGANKVFLSHQAQPTLSNFFKPSFRLVLPPSRAPPRTFLKLNSSLF